TAGVEVAIPLREVAAGDVEAQAVTRGDPNADRPEAQLVPIDLARFERGRIGQGVAEAGANDSLLKIGRASGGGDLAETRSPVGVRGRGGGVKDDGDVADQAEVAGQRFTRVDQDAVPLFALRLNGRTHRGDEGEAARMSAPTHVGDAGVVGEDVGWLRGGD